MDEACFSYGWRLWVEKEESSQRCPVIPEGESGDKHHGRIPRKLLETTLDAWTCRGTRSRSWHWPELVYMHYFFCFLYYFVFCTFADKTTERLFQLKRLFKCCVWIQWSEAHVILFWLQVDRDKSRILIVKHEVRKNNIL